MTRVAEILIFTMPWALGFKTVSFTIIFLMLIKQETNSRLAWWINSFFIVMVFNSLWVTGLVAFLTMTTDGEDIDNWQKWTLLVGLNILPILASISGFQIVRWNSKMVIYDKEEDVLAI